MAPKHLRLLRPFVLASIAAGSGGSVLGHVLLWRTQGSLSGTSWPLRQVHAQLQLFGFLIPFAVGFAVFVVPRIAGGQPISRRRVARGALLALVSAIALTGVLPLVDAPSARWLKGANALAVLSGTMGAGWALHGPIHRHARAVGGRGSVGYLWLLELALLFLVLSGLADAVGMLRSGSAGLPLLAEPWGRAAYRLALDGFGVGLALGVSARMFTGFLGVDPRRAFPSKQSAYARDPGDARRFFLSVGAWGAAVVLAAAGELLGQRLVHAAEVLFAVGVIPLALRLGLGSTRNGLPIDRAQDPAFPFGARACYALLVAAALVGGIAGGLALAGRAVSFAWIDVRRHLLAIGFLMTLIATMAGRLAPGYARRPLALPWLRRGALYAFVVAAVLRAFEGPAFELGWPALLVLSVASGPIAVAAFAALFLSLAVTLLRSREAG